LNARPHSFDCCFTRTGVDLTYGSTADQGRTGRKDSSSRLWRPARALGTHAKQGPSTGHSAVGLRQAGKLPPDAEATFHRSIMQLGNQVVGASDGAPFRQERRPTRLCRTPGAGSGLLAEASTLRAGTSNIPPCRTLGRRTGMFRARYGGRAPGCGRSSAHRTFDHARRACHAMPTGRTRAQP
jgi:hypothetical protein